MRLRLLFWLLLATPGLAAAEARTAHIAAVSAPDLSEWEARIAQLLAKGELAPRWERTDTLLPGRTHQRLRQLHRGLPVYGGELVRQLDGERTVSVFGTFYEGIEVDPKPSLTPEQAAAAVERLTGDRASRRQPPELVVYPREATYALCYRSRAGSERDIKLYFLDARTGAVVHSRSDLHTQSAVGTGRGVLGDLKKMSTRPSGGAFVTEDELRPPPLRSHDMRGNLFRTIDFLLGDIDLTASDLAHDTDNSWDDGAVVDAHAYAGWTYDYFFKRFGRRGLDNADLRILSLVHPVRREDALSQPDEILFLFYLNAFYAGDGIVVYGEGLPPHLSAFGLRWNFFAGALDVVAHELTHGVTDYSSALIYEGESGALNEAFSDIMGTSVEFHFQPPGGGPLQADYLLGEDVITPGGIRSMANPRAYGDPDHYSIRFRGSADNGGVHINSGIANHAFYLAIEGGTNRTSGLSVQGVGAANREQIEKVFYRAFVNMLPPRANFSTARGATIQAARDLYGPGSAAERAVTQAWTAVGVQ